MIGINSLLVYYLKRFKNLLIAFYPNRNGVAIEPVSGKEVHKFEYGVKSALPINSRER